MRHQTHCLQAKAHRPAPVQHEPLGTQDAVRLAGSSGGEAGQGSLFAYGPLSRARGAPYQFMKQLGLEHPASSHCPSFRLCARTSGSGVFLFPTGRRVVAVRSHPDAVRCQRTPVIAGVLYLRKPNSPDRSRFPLAVCEREQVRLRKVGTGKLCLHPRRWAGEGSLGGREVTGLQTTTAKAPWNEQRWTEYRRNASYLRLVGGGERGIRTDGSASL